MPLPLILPFTHSPVYLKAKHEEVVGDEITFQQLERPKEDQNLLVTVGIPAGSLSLDHIVLPVAEVLGSIIVQIFTVAVSLSCKVEA